MHDEGQACRGRRRRVLGMACRGRGRRIVAMVCRGRGRCVGAMACRGRRRRVVAMACRDRGRRVGVVVPRPRTSRWGGGAEAADVALGQRRSETVSFVRQVHGNKGRGGWDTQDGRSPGAIVTTRPARGLQTIQNHRPRRWSRGDEYLIATGQPTIPNHLDGLIVGNPLVGWSATIAPGERPSCVSHPPRPLLP